MTQEKAVELPRYVKAHIAAKALSLRQVVHSKAFRFASGAPPVAAHVLMFRLKPKSDRNTPQGIGSRQGKGGLHPANR